MSAVLRLDGDEKVQILEYFVGSDGEHLAEIVIPKSEHLFGEVDITYPVPVSRLVLASK